MNRKSKPSKPLKVMLDTSFLVVLFSPEHSLHRQALSYLSLLKGQKARLCISTLAIAEFSTKSNAIELITRSLGPQIIGYSIEDALAYGPLTGRFPWLYKRKMSGQTKAEQERTVIDFMMAAQAERNGIDYIVTSDKGFTKHINGIEEYKVKILDFGRSPEENMPIFDHVHLDDTEIESVPGITDRELN